MNTAAETLQKTPRHIRVSGGARDRGRQYGEQAADLVAVSIKNYQAMFATCDIDWASAQTKTDICIGTVEQHFPMLLEELHGIAEGSGQSIESILALNCRTEILPADYLLRASCLPADQLPDAGHISECTSLGFARQAQPVWLAQTWDWVGFQRDAMVLLESHPDEGPSHLTVTEAGMPAKIGFNDTGLGITLNILRSARDGQSAGLPVHLFLRALLDCENVTEAIKLAKKHNFTSSSNIMIADAQRNISSIEVSPNAVAFLPAQNGALCHTNHFIDSSMAGQDAGLTGNISTESRLNRANKALPEINTLEDIHALLGNTEDGQESICRFPDSSLPVSAQIETVVSVAMNLTDKVLWVTAAQPSVHEYVPFTIN